MFAGKVERISHQGGTGSEIARDEAQLRPCSWDQSGTPQSAPAPVTGAPAW